MEDILDEEPTLSFRKTAAPIFRKDRHLSSALLTTEIAYIMTNRDNPKGLKREHRDLVARLDSTVTISPSDSFFSWAFNHWTQLAFTSEPVHELTTALQIASKALQISVLDYTGLEDHTQLIPDSNLTTLYRVKENFNTVLENITFKTAFHQSYTLGKFQGDAYGNLHLFWCDPTHCFLITHSHLVGLRDAINAWFDVSLYALFSVNKYPGFNLYDEVCACLEAGRQTVIRHKGEAYALFKMWPSLAIASVLRDTENKRSFMTTLESEVSAYRDDKLYHIMTRPLLTDPAVHLGLELSGLWKCFGHPDIDMDASVSKWISKGAAMKLGLGSISQLLVWTFRLEFCRQYYRQTRRWPSALIAAGAPERIKYCYRNNLWEERPSSPWAPEDFEHVILQQNLDFNYHVDISDLLADRSIIPSLEQWIYEYDSQAHRTIHGFFPKGPPPTSKSVIVHYLLKERISVKEIIDQLQKGNLPPSWRVMVAVPKEREFKRKDARFYGKMTFEMRLYQTATEKNIADNVFKYIKHQSMTMSEEQLTRTVHRMNTPTIQIEGETYVFITLDFSSWCTNFRHELITPLFQELDKLFGLRNVYAFTHVFPILSYLLFQDRYAPPRQDPQGNPTNGPRCYYGPEAWLEGLRQKGWTLATIMIILLSSWRCGTSASLLGQGDNQVILLKIPPKTYLQSKGLTRDAYIDQYLCILQDLCEQAGIVIKLEETWYSRNLFEYSRKYHYKGSQISGALKRISRLASEANQVIPSVNGDLSGFFSTGASTAAEDQTPRAAYFCTIVEAALHLRSHNTWLQKEPWEVTCSLLLLTRSLGGYPITIYSQFCTRAVQDVLSTNLHLVRTALRDRHLRPHISRLANITPGKVDFLSLIKDPQSLPLAMPVQPENYVLREIKKGLEQFIKNLDVKLLFSVQADTERDNLVADLASITPCNPKLLNKLYSLSNVGLQEKWAGMFANTRSIQQTAFKSWSSELDVINVVRELDKRFSEFLRKKRSSGIEVLQDVTCVTTYTQYLRETLWGLKIEGITMPPQQEQTRLCTWSSLSTEQARRSILYTCQENSHQHHKATCRGKYAPYFGSTTQIRARRATLQVVEVSSLVTSLKNLLELKGWVRGNPEMAKFLDCLIKEKTTILPEELDKYTRQVYSGSLSHRLPCPALRRGGMANQNLNHSSFYNITSDTALDFAKGGQNYTICFQSCFLYGLSVLAHRTELNVPTPDQMGLLFVCTCTWNIPLESFDILTSRYRGLDLPIKIGELHHKDTYERYPTHQSVDEYISYAVIMARRFAAWIVNRKIIDKITSLDNRAMEENVTVSFLNLAEFSRLSVPLFLNSFVFYCAVYDNTFLNAPHEYFDDVVEGMMKNPYDVLIDGLVKCDHLRVLGNMYTGVPSPTYTRQELRILLFNVLSRLCDDLPQVMSTAYILTPDDPIHVTVRAIHLWLYTKELPCHSSLKTTVTASELTDLLQRHYSDYPAIQPVCTLSEEEAIARIRQHKIQGPLGMDGSLCKVNLGLPAIVAPEARYTTIPLLCTVGSSLTSSLAQLILQEDFLSIVNGRPLITLDDPEGLVYCTLMHSGVFQGGFPHWGGNTSWDREPQAIASDRCSIPWRRDLYLKNGPQRIVHPIPGALVVLCGSGAATSYTHAKRIITLGRYRDTPVPCIATFKTTIYVEPFDTWVLYDPSVPILRFRPATSVESLVLSNATTAFTALRDPLIAELAGPSCLSPFGPVHLALGSVPPTASALVLIIRGKLRQITASLSRGRIPPPTTYEGAIEEARLVRLRERRFLLIASYHLILHMLYNRPWLFSGCRGLASYHTHKKGFGLRVCWSLCGVGSVRVDFGTLRVAMDWWVWLRYLWVLCQVDTARLARLRLPRVEYVS